MIGMRSAALAVLPNCIIALFEKISSSIINNPNTTFLLLEHIRELKI